jgi:hypothetical protein
MQFGGRAARVLLIGNRTGREGGPATPMLGFTGHGKGEGILGICGKRWRRRGHFWRARHRAGEDAVPAPPAFTGLDQGDAGRSTLWRCPCCSRERLFFGACLVRARAPGVGEPRPYLNTRIAGGRRGPNTPGWPGTCHGATSESIDGFPLKPVRGRRQARTARECVIFAFAERV